MSPLSTSFVSTWSSTTTSPPASRSQTKSACAVATGMKLRNAVGSTAAMSSVRPLMEAEAHESETAASTPSMALIRSHRLLRERLGAGDEGVGGAQLGEGPRRVHGVRRVTARALLDRRRGFGRRLVRSATAVVVPPVPPVPPAPSVPAPSVPPAASVPSVSSALLPVPSSATSPVVGSSLTLSTRLSWLHAVTRSPRATTWEATKARRQRAGRGDMALLGGATACGRVVGRRVARVRSVAWVGPRGYSHCPSRRQPRGDYPASGGARGRIGG